MRLTSEEQRALLKIARSAISKHLRNEDFTVNEYRIQGNLALRYGAFVTLRLEGQLRGCIGYVVSERPLAETIADIAVKAASEDPRFAPITNEEFDSINIEISVLSEIEELSEPENLIIGEHGLYFEGENFRGLLLPQVAVENNWDRKTFLAQLGRKAGIPDFSPEKPEGTIYVFTAIVFNESNVAANV